MDINFELYKIFYHSAREKSFSTAADKLHISQSAVSQAIKNLEIKIGVQLFFRNTRQIKLTQEGEMLFKHIEQAYNFIKTAENKITDMQSLNSGEIRIGVSDTVCRYFLIPYLEKFNSLYPGIKIQVINRTSTGIIDLLKKGTVDFGIVTLPVQEKTFNIKEFLTVEDILVTSQKFTKLKRGKLPLDDLAKYPILMLEKSSATRQNFDRFLAENKIKINPEIELGSMELLVEFARIGLGVAHVLKESAIDLIKSGELFEVKVREILPKRKLGIITSKDVPVSYASGEFIELLGR